MIYMHSSLRTATASLIQTLCEYHRASFASRVAQVWTWYTSHADGYTPSREQAKRELGLSDYILTKCLRALQRLHLAALDITRAAGKVGCWRVFKRPMTDGPCKPILPPIFDQKISNPKPRDNTPEPVLPPSFCHPKEPVLPPKNCPPLSNKEQIKVTNIITPPLTTPTMSEGEGGSRIDQFLDAYPKPADTKQRRIAKALLAKLTGGMDSHQIGEFVSKLSSDCANRVKFCHFWRNTQFMPNVVRYVAECIWLNPMASAPASAPQQPLRAGKHTTRDMTLGQELNDRSWAL